MSILKPLLLLCLLSAGAALLRAQPATPSSSEKPGPAMDAEAERRARELLEKLSSSPVHANAIQTAPPAVAAQPISAPVSNAAPRAASVPPPAASVASPAPNTADSDAQARELLHKLTSPSAQPLPGVAAAPPDLQNRDAARTQALIDARRVSAAQPENVNVQSGTLTDAQREREISRIENEIEAARKRREATANLSLPQAAPSLNNVTPVTDSRGLAILQSQTASTIAQNAPARVAPSAQPAATPAFAGQPAAVASPAAPTLTPEAEQKARDLLRRNIFFIQTDNPPAQRVRSPARAVLPLTETAPAAAPVFPSPAVNVPPATPPPAASVSTPAASITRPPAPSTAAVIPSSIPSTGVASGLTPEDEQRARDLLHQIGAPSKGDAFTVAPGTSSVPNTGIIAPPAATLDLPPPPATTPVAPPVAVGLPKPQPVPPPAVAVEKPVAAPPPVEIPQPPATPVAPAVATPPLAATPPAAVAPETVTNPQDEAARAVVRQAVANLREGSPAVTAALPPPSIPSTPAPPVETAPSIATATSSPATAPAANTQTGAALTPDVEARVRELLHQQGADATRVTPVSPPPPAVVTTAPAYTGPAPAIPPSLPPTSPAPPVAPPAAGVSTPPVAATPPAIAQPTDAVPSVGGLSADAELKARELVSQQVTALRSNPSAGFANVASPTTSTPSPAVPSNAGSADELKAKRELIKQQEREGKKRRAEEKRIEELAKKEAEKMDRQGTAAAREQARKQLEAEAKAREQGKPIAKKSDAAGSSAPFKLAPGSKRQRLDQLTDAYVHDKIGPEEYHRERAKIVSEPGE